MPHVSRKLLEHKHFLDIHKEFAVVITDLFRSGKGRAVIDTFFTKTEKLMFAKRLAIILMLDQGESTYAIEQILKVSPSTVALMSLEYEKGTYSSLLKQIGKENSFWTELSKIIPPRVGRNRFKNFLKF